MSRKMSQQRRARARELQRNRPGHRHVKTAWEKLPEVVQARLMADRLQHQDTPPAR